MWIMMYISKMLKNIKDMILGIVIGGTIIGGGVIATTVSSSSVTYSNSTSKLSSTNVQGAIDALYIKTEKALVPDASSFSTDSWKTIAKAVKSNSYPYKVGDTKTIDMGSFGTHTVRIANISSCSYGETSKTTCGFVVEFADIITTHNMNSSSINVGGWPASAMRTYVNGTIYNALPSELQNVIISTTVVSGYGPNDSSNFTSTDKLYLLSTKEVWNGGTSYDTAETETRQLDYYKNKGVTTSNYSVARKQYNGSNSYWWLRSARFNDSNDFCLVGTAGGWFSSTANYTFGVSPAFRIA